MAGLDKSKKRGDSSTPRVSRFSEILGAAQESTQKRGYPDPQLSTQQDIQKSESPEIQPPEQTSSQKPAGKRENPNYTQTTFRIPKKLSRQINRVLMDLADEGVEMDRSDLLQELAGAFLRLADEKGVAAALEQFQNLGTQVDD